MSAWRDRPCPCGCGRTVQVLTDRPTELERVDAEWDQWADDVMARDRATLADQGVGTDARCSAHPNEDLPCRECAVDPRDFYREGGEFYAGVGDSVWSTCLCAFDYERRHAPLRMLDVACPVHARDRFDPKAFVARVGVDKLTEDQRAAYFGAPLYDDTLIASAHFVDTFDNPVLGPEWVQAEDDVLFTEGYALIDPEIVDAIHGHLHDR